MKTLVNDRILDLVGWAVLVFSTFAVVGWLVLMGALAWRGVWWTLTGR